jgi:ssRNA-specific RNase YbeY (16S rRNA maturation enzyme)
MSVNLEKIEFKNNQEPAISATNLNQMQENTQNAINKLDSERNYIEISMTENQNITAGNNTIINFNKKERGEGIELNNNTLTVSEAGIYLIELDLHYTNLTQNSRAFGDIVISNNGDYGDKVLRTNDTQQYSGDAFFNGLGLVQLQAGAQITFKTYTTYTNDLMGTASPKTRAFVKRI